MLTEEQKRYIEQKYKATSTPQSEGDYNAAEDVARLRQLRQQRQNLETYKQTPKGKSFLEKLSGGTDKFLNFAGNITGVNSAFNLGTTLGEGLTYAGAKLTGNKNLANQILMNPVAESNKIASEKGTIAGVKDVLGKTLETGLAATSFAGGGVNLANTSFASRFPTLARYTGYGATGGSYGAGFGASNALQGDADTKELFKETLQAGLTGAIAGVAIPAIVEGTVRAAKNIATLYSGVPKDALQGAFDNPEVIGQKVREYAKTPEQTKGVLDKANKSFDAIKKIRSEEYQNGLKKLEKEVFFVPDKGVAPKIAKNISEQLDFATKDAEKLLNVAQKSNSEKAWNAFSKAQTLVDDLTLQSDKAFALSQGVKPGTLYVKNNVGDAFDDITKEASKYDSADEFVKAQGTPKTVSVWNKSKFSNDGAYADIPVIRKEENITLYQGGKAGDGRQFWTPDKKYAEQFGNVNEKTGSFYKIDNGNRVADVYVEAPTKSQLTDIWNKAKTLGVKTNALWKDTKLTKQSIRTFVTQQLNQTNINRLPEVDQKTINKLTKLVKNWDDITPLGLDNLRARLGNEAKTLTTPEGQRFLYGVQSDVRDYVAKRIPQIGEMNKTYAKSSEFIGKLQDEIFGKTSSMKDSTKLERLLGIFNQKNDLRQDLIKELGEKAGTDLLNEITGAVMAEWIPTAWVQRFILGSGAATAVTGGINAPAMVVGAAAASPRIVGKAARILGQANRLTPLIKKASPFGIKALIDETNPKP